MAKCSAKPPAATPRTEPPTARRRKGSLDILQLGNTAHSGKRLCPLFDLGHGHGVGAIFRVLVKTGKESLLSSPSGPP